MSHTKGNVIKTTGIEYVIQSKKDTSSGTWLVRPRLANWLGDPTHTFDIVNITEPKNKLFTLFTASSIAFGSTGEFVKRVPRSYRVRGKIETG